MWHCIAAILLLFAVFSHGEDCDKVHMDYSFTRCVYGFRDVIFFWNKNNCTNSPPSPIKNVPCNTTCAPGYYLGINFLSNSSIPTISCLSCPANTYTPGNTFRLSHYDLNWDNLPPNSQTYLFFEEPLKEYYSVENVPAFVPNSEGSMLTTNISAAIPGTWNILQFTLVLESYSNGTVNFTYWKESRKVDNSVSGIFEFLINEEVIMTDGNFTTSSWKTYSYPIAKGINQFTWTYAISTSSEYYYSGLYAYISHISVTNAMHTPLSCIPCKLGNSPPGSATCIRCPTNTVWVPSTNSCEPCYKGTTTLLDDDTCGIQPPCNPYYDSEAVYGVCKNSTMEVTYKWRNNVLCDVANSELPEAKTVACAECEEGYYLNGTSCKQCPIGWFSNTENAKECTMCRAGGYTPMVERYENLQRIPKDMENECYPVKPNMEGLCQRGEGWIVVNGTLTTHPRMSAGVKYVLRKRLKTVQRAGKVEIQYINKGYEKGNDIKESFKIKIDKTVHNLPLNSTSIQTKSFPLTAGSYVIEWITERLITDHQLVPFQIISINIQGSAGVADSCVPCPIGEYSTNASTRCEKCPPGQQPNPSLNSCVQCPKGTFKSDFSAFCESCPKHTRSSRTFTKCELYDAYNINDEYIFNAIKFDSTRALPLDELKDLPKSESFFGPFTDSSRSAHLFLSLAKPMTYDVEKYQYDVQEDNIEEGHAFILLPAPPNHEHSFLVKEKMKKSKHYVKHNIGSVLKEFDLTELWNGRIRLVYGDGDYCQNAKQFKLVLTLHCDNSVGTLGQVEFLTQTDPCEYRVNWKTPYACSQCKQNETKWEIAKCMDEKRRIDIAEGPHCIIHESKGQPFEVETITLNSTSHVVCAMAETAAPHKELDYTYNGFVYSKRFYGECNEMEFTMPIVYGVIFVLILVGLLAGITIFLTLKYKKEYYQLVGSSEYETEMKEMGPDTNLEF